MNKLKKGLQGIWLLLKAPSLLNLITESEERWDRHLQQKYPKKRNLPTVQIETLLPDFQETLHTFSFLGGGSLPTDIMLLKGLAKKTPDCSYFEIGTWRGESVVNVAEVAKTCTTLNLSKKEILALGLSEKYAELHGFFSKETPNITHLFGDSMHYNFAALQQKFDLIFIDGNHKYPYVKNDSEKVFAHLVHPESIVVWHDAAFHPEKIRSEVVAGILEGVPTEFHTQLYHVSNTLCAIYLPQKIKNSFENFPTTPSKTFTVSLGLTALTRPV